MESHSLIEHVGSKHTRRTNYGDGILNTLTVNLLVNRGQVNIPFPILVYLGLALSVENHILFYNYCIRIFEKEPTSHFEC